ncbi:UNVERIFIED_CONTAM: hypothetical protein K2H54_062202 [Gekko kuhli]
MSAAEEELIPVTSGYIPVTTEQAITVTTGAGIHPSRLEWGRFNLDTYEIWTLTTPRNHWESWYQLPRVMESIQEDPALAPRRESDLPEYFLDTSLGILKWGYDHIMQTVEATLTAVPQMVADVIQRA